MQEVKLNSLIENTNLNADCLESNIKKLCKDAIEYQFRAVCVHPFWIKKAQSILEKTPVLIATVIDFPFGSEMRRTRLGMVTYAIDSGVHEVDIVAPLHFMQAEQWDSFFYDIQGMVERAKNKAFTKIILENSLFDENPEKIKKAVILCAEAGVNFIKTSTGIINKRSTSLQDLKLIKESLGDNYPKVQIKVSGGIKTREQALEFAKNGANRIGTSSALTIVSQ